MSVSVVAAALVAAAAASTTLAASGGAPLSLQKFSMQTIAATHVSFGPKGFEFKNEPYTYTQAGGHPWGLTTTVEFGSEEVPAGEGGTAIVPTKDAKEVVVNLPPGLLGDPLATPRCPLAKAISGEPCPVTTQVGEANVVFFGGHKEARGPIYNVVPESGQSAEFAFEATKGVTFVLTGHVVNLNKEIPGAPARYGLTVVSDQIPMAELVKAELTFWGVPADPSHNLERGLRCLNTGEGVVSCAGGQNPAELTPIPFLSMPADCSSGSQEATLTATSWQEPTRYVTAKAAWPAATGCDALQFNPSIELQPETTLADEPTGVGVNLLVPQVEQPGIPVTPQLRRAVVTLPEGMSVSPGAVDGAVACPAFGPHGINMSGSESEEIGTNGERRLAPGHCPPESTLGTVEAITPLLPSPVQGHLYLAEPGCGGTQQPACTQQDELDGNLYRLYLEVGGTGELADAGVNLKIEGRAEANPVTGQLTTVFEGNPQLPFSELRIDLRGGPRAPLANPGSCGTATLTSEMTPWSAPGTTPEGIFAPGTPDATPSTYYGVTGCTSTPALLSPGFSAGTVSSQAGKYSPFTLTFTRRDREQTLSEIQVRTPTGLVGVLSHVPLCPEPEAAAGTCPADSQIGTTTVASGAGSHPFEIGGAVYLTAGYKGAPFGLSVVTHVVAGPFNLGVVVVRARVNVDPHTAALIVTSDPLPQIVFGVPLRLQRVTVDIDRPDFMFNPTNCATKRIEASISGAQHTVASVSVPFTVAGCKGLQFRPSFAVTTNGQTSRTKGASLDAKLTFPAGFGEGANVAFAKVSLPRHLPSRLSTLQKACPARIFESNPVLCPRDSVVGAVRASTPVLPVELTGPVYFVSHGGEQFPSLVVVLQGYGIRVDLIGTTFISKANITSTTFKTVPDVPVRSFELYLPQGKNSALAATAKLCKLKSSELIMPTEFRGENHVAFKQKTHIKVTGCAKVAKKKVARTRRAGK